jgi:hypothetical protein
MKAFPTAADNGHSDNQDGMELRDYFAAKAMQAIIGICYKELDVGKDKEGIVESAYEIADEMLKTRKYDS